MEITEFAKQAINEFAKKTLEFPWENKNAYAAWLSQTNCYVTHSTRLLALAAARFPIEENGHHSRFLDHLKEERGHEFMVRKDIENLGFKLETFGEFPVTAAFYQTQYYCLEHLPPVAFYGWIVALEGLAAKVGKDLMARVTAAHGAKCNLFIRVHAEEDIEHLEKALQQISKLPKEQQKLIENNMKLAVDLYSKMLDEAKKFANSTKITQVA